ncbi:hypothetical protein BHM03_00010968 [Ensete ventricosum]|nr:hypothetical protein BHM03_00010968 [Ensete ventricosum]
MVTTRRGSGDSKKVQWCREERKGGIEVASVEVAAATTVEEARGDQGCGRGGLGCGRSGWEEKKGAAGSDEGYDRGKKRQRRRTTAASVRALATIEEEERGWPMAGAGASEEGLAPVAGPVIFLEVVTRAAVAAAGGRGWEQKAGAAGERQFDLVRAAREGREMTGMAGGDGREGNRGGRRRKRRPRERREGKAAWVGVAGGSGREERQ